MGFYEVVLRLEEVDGLGVYFGVFTVVHALAYESRRGVSYGEI